MLGCNRIVVFLSNLGVIKLPEEYEKYVTTFSTFASTDDIQLCVCSYKNDLILNFSSHFVSKDIERSFLKEIQKEIDAELQLKREKRDRLEMESSYVWRDVHKLQEELEELEKEIQETEVEETVVAEVAEDLLVPCAFPASFCFLHSSTDIYAIVSLLIHLTSWKFSYLRYTEDIPCKS